MLGALIKTFFNFICGGLGDKPTQQQQQQYPPPQQPQYQYPPQPQHQQHQWQPPIHKPQQVPHKPQYYPPQPQSEQPPPKPPHVSLPFNKDQNSTNQQNNHYVGLRSQANEEGDAMARCFEESHQAYARGDGAGAKEFSNQGKEHKKRMEDLNKRASEWIFIENNKDSQAHEIDLHGLYVKEAIAFTDKALQEARGRGDKEIHLIVGKGLHSKNGAAKLKPAIEELIQKYSLSANLDPNNAGVLIVQLDSDRGRGVGADEITRRIERNEDSCIIM